MTELLIVLAMALVAWLGYIRGHNAGVMECKRQYFAHSFQLFGERHRPTFDEWRKQRAGGHS